jgi:hypothetical protein
MRWIGRKTGKNSQGSAANVSGMGVAMSDQLEQPDLFAFSPPPRGPRPEMEQELHLRRVRGNIEPAIMAFARKTGVGGWFHAQELYDFVKSGYGIAPGSADRILRYLRQDNLLDYVVLKRGKSLYQFIAIADVASEGVGNGSSTDQVPLAQNTRPSQHPRTG